MGERALAMTASRAPADIERDIAVARTRLAADLEAIEDALAPRRLARLAGQSLAARLEHPRRAGERLILPLALLAIGVVLLALPRRRPVVPRAPVEAAPPQITAGL